MEEILKEFIEWYEWSGYDAFEVFDNKEKVIKEFMEQRNY